MTTPKNDPYWQGPDERAGVPTEHDPVERPSHYILPSGIEVIQAVEHLPLCRGAAVQYILRAGHKAGVDEIEDLKKARWNIEREIRRMEALRAAPCEVGSDLCPEHGVPLTFRRPDDMNEVGGCEACDADPTFYESRMVTYVPPQKKAPKKAITRRAVEAALAEAATQVCEKKSPKRRAR